MTAPAWEWPNVKDTDGDLAAFKRLCNVRFGRLRDRLGRMQSTLDWVNVVEDFGAAGNGTTDDTAKIQLAATAAAGRVLYFPPGRTYKITRRITLASRTMVWGHGATLWQVTPDDCVLYGPGVDHVQVVGLHGVGPGRTAFSDPNMGLVYFTHNGVTPSSDITILQVEVEEHGCGISVFRVLRPTVAQCVSHGFAGAGSSGMQFSQSSDFFFDKNRVFDCTQTGAVCYGLTGTGDAAGGHPQGSGVLQASVIDGIRAWDAIMCHEVSDIAVCDSVITDCRGGIDLGALLTTNVIERVSVTGNTIHLTTVDAWAGVPANSVGIGFAGGDATHRATGGTFTGNVITGHGQIPGATFAGDPAAVVIRHADTVSLAGTTIQGQGNTPNAFPGIYLIGALNNVSINGTTAEGHFSNGVIQCQGVVGANIQLGDLTVTQTIVTDPVVVVANSSLTGFAFGHIASNSSLPLLTIASTIEYASGLYQEDSATGLRLTPTPLTLGYNGAQFQVNGSALVGTDRGVQDLYLRGPLGTGAGNPGRVLLRGGKKGSSGTTPHLEYTALWSGVNDGSTYSTYFDTPASPGAVALVLAFANVIQAILGASNGADQLIVSSSAGDFCLRTQSGRQLFSVDGGATVHDTLTSTGRTLAVSIRLPYRSVAGDATVTDADYSLDIDATGAARTVTLPAASGRTGMLLEVRKSDATANTVTVDGNGAELINGAATFVLATQYSNVTVRCDGTGWGVL
jgi:hypothetical protein